MPSDIQSILRLLYFNFPWLRLTEAWLSEAMQKLRATEVYLRVYKLWSTLQERGGNNNNKFNDSVFPFYTVVCYRLNYNGQERLLSLFTLFYLLSSVITDKTDLTLLFGSLMSIFGSGSLIIYEELRNEKKKSKLVWGLQFAPFFCLRPSLRFFSDNIFHCLFKHLVRFLEAIA